MFAAWSRIPPDKRRAWGMVAGALTVGTVVKVAYFKFSRRIMVDDATRKHKEGLEHLREAREFAEWSNKDREARLPKLTADQKHQMMEYIKIVEHHGMSKSFEASAGSNESCEGCPVMGSIKKAKQALSQSSSSD